MCVCVYVCSYVNCFPTEELLKSYHEIKDLLRSKIEKG